MTGIPSRCVGSPDNRRLTSSVGMSDISFMDVDTLIEKAGGVGKLAETLDVSHPTICDWKRTGFIPGSRAVQISNALKLKIEDVSKLIKPASTKKASV